MVNFNNNRITAESENLGRELKQARRKQGLSLEEAGKELQINPKYLSAIEEGDFHLLPSGVYGKNFLREYALHLSLEPDRLIKSYEKKALPERQSRQKEVFSKKIPGKRNFLAVPRIIKGAAIFMTIAICLGYLAVSVEKITSPPKLTVINLPDDYTTEQNNLTLMGKTEPEAEVSINGEPVLIDADGIFTQKINLKDGLNTVLITAQKKYSKKQTLVKQILVQDNADS